MFEWMRRKNIKDSQIPHQETNSETIPIEKSIEEIQLETFINKLVICASNEVENITVGYGKEIIHITKAKIPRLIVYDIVNKEEIMPLCKMFDYTEQKFNALNKLEPNERISILYDFGDSIVNKKAREGDIVYPPEVWAEKVNAAIEQWKQEKELVKAKKLKF